MSPNRGPGATACRHALRGAWLPTLLAAAAAGWLAPPPATTGAGSGGANSPWLLLPIAVAAVVCGYRALGFWPLLGTGRPGAEWLQRLPAHPARSTLRVIGGALAANLLLVLPVLLALPPWLGAPPAARTHHAIAFGELPVLAPDQPELRSTARLTAACNQLLLRPLAAPPVGAPEPTRVVVLADGEPLLAPLPWSGTVPRLAVEFAARPLGTLTLRRADGSVPLYWPPGSVVAVAAEPRSRWLNALLAAGIATLPLATALACAWLAGRVATRPTVALVGGGVMLPQLAGGLGPAEPTAAALLRGEWLGGAAHLQDCLPALGVVAVALLLAMHLPARTRR